MRKRALILLIAPILTIATLHAAVVLESAKKRVKMEISGMWDVQLVSNILPKRAMDTVVLKLRIVLTIPHVVPHVIPEPKLANGNASTAFLEGVVQLAKNSRHSPAMLRNARTTSHALTLPSAPPHVVLANKHAKRNASTA